jgi:hypothetical protein
MNPGIWLPAKIDRDYMILRGPGIRVEQGDYFLRLLATPAGRVTRFLLAKKRGVRADQIDLAKGRANDGSFAMVLDFAHEFEVPAAYQESKVYCLSSGESTAISVYLKGGKTEWRSELLGLAGPSEKLQRHP